MAEITDDNVFVIPLPIGSKVYRKDGWWVVFGYDCDYVGTWRVKLKREAEKHIGNTEYARPLVSCFGKTFFLTREEYEMRTLKTK